MPIAMSGDSVPSMMGDSWDDLGSKIFYKKDDLGFIKFRGKNNLGSIYCYIFPWSDYLLLQLP